jgi:hypothetical protein
VEWEFTPADVVKGEVAYGLEGFRDDLATEVRLNVSVAFEEEYERAFALIYDLCYWLATGREFELFLVELGDELDSIRLAKAVRDAMEPNVEMLGAILQRVIMDRVEAGMRLEQAIQAAADVHARILRQMPPSLDQLGRARNAS